MQFRNERSLSLFDQHRLVQRRSDIAAWRRSWKSVGGCHGRADRHYASGHPFNLLLGFDANRDTNANTDRPNGAGRNTGIGN